MNRKKRRKTKQKKSSFLALKAFFSALLVVFAFAAANLSFMSFARDTLSNTISENISIEAVKEIGLNTFAELKNNVITVFDEEETEETEKIRVKINPPESFLPETE